MLREGDSAGLAPALNFTAIGSGRTFQLQSPGVVLVLLCFAQETRQQVKGFAASLAERLPDVGSESIAVCHIADLRHVPRLLRGVAEKMLELEYERAAGELEPGLDPAEYVIIVPDWDGSICDGLGVPDVRNGARCVVVLPDGEVASLMESIDLDACVAWLSQIGLTAARDAFGGTDPGGD